MPRRLVKNIWPNPGINSPATDAENGVGGQGNFPGQLGGWGAGNGGAYCCSFCSKRRLLFSRSECLNYLKLVVQMDSIYKSDYEALFLHGNYNWRSNQWNDVGMPNGEQMITYMEC